MASSHQKNDDVAIECAVCSEIFRNPTILVTCGHTFCKQCIKEMQGSASQVECPICRRVTNIPPDGLPLNYIVLDIIEDVKKRHDYQLKTIKSIKEFHRKVSPICEQLNEKLQQWYMISETLNDIAAKSLEMIETTESMDRERCQKILKDIKKMSKIVSRISSNFRVLQENHHLTVLQQNRDNILIRDTDDQLPPEISRSLYSRATAPTEEIPTNDVLIIGGFDGSRSLKSLELYNPSNANDNLFHRCKLNDERFDHISAVLSDTLYVVGGSVCGDVPSKSVELIDIVRHQWLGYGPEMNIARTCSAGVAIYGRILVFGGHGPALSSCESFHPIEQMWSFLPDMEQGRWGHAAVELNDQIYLIGGGVTEWKPVQQEQQQKQRPKRDSFFNYITGAIMGRNQVQYQVQSQIQNQVQNEVLEPNLVSIFNPNTPKWLPCPSMQQARVSPAAAKFDNVIIVTGGHDKYRRLRSCEMFDPRVNKWMEIAPMIQDRREHVLINCNGKLWAMGGEYYEGNSLSTVEEYDQRANRWRPVVKQMKGGRFRFAAVTLQ